MLTEHSPEAANFTDVVVLLIKSYDRLISRTQESGALELLKELRSVDPLVSALVVSLLIALLCLILSLITKNYSQVDRLWSLLPIYYTFHFAILPYLTSPSSQLPPRLIIMQVLVLIWGSRLTFNFWRKGGYNLKGEDYRWAVVEAFIGNQTMWLLFNVIFICSFQNILLMLLALPAYIAQKVQSTNLTFIDITATTLFFIFLVIEIVSDEQQWNFQSKKHLLVKEKKPLTGDYQAGFLTKGIFAFSRHPNFFAEISLWWTYYLFSVAASGVWINYSIIGPILLTLLFQGSTTLTESISSRKYPLYTQYQATTSRLIPWIPRIPEKKLKKK